MQSRFKLKVWKLEELPLDWVEKTRRRSARTVESVEKQVKRIVNDVKERGDAALTEFTQKFDKAKLKPEDFRVTVGEIQKAYSMVSEEQVAAIKLMKDRVSSFESLLLKQMNTAASIGGIIVQSTLFPLESVGCYVPGGKAAYPSTVVMTAAPARVAGVSRIVVCSPPNETGVVNPLVLVAADICGVHEIYKVGGAQAIAALAYGTETIKPVRKIVGPGNKYVTLAKVLVSNDAAIDMPAGPSEVLVLADKTANPQFVAFDMISQAEHGEDSVAGLITTSKELADAVLSCLDTMTASMDRKNIVKKALAKFGFIIICHKMDRVVTLANLFAPEHLEIVTENPLEIANKITSAGLILIGPYSPVSLSDYASGTNHVLPTGGFAHTYSGLSALDFVRRVNVVESSKEALFRLRNHVKVLTEAENLPNHRRAVEVRFEDERQV